MVKQAGLKAGDSLVVLGCGGVGLSAIMISSALGIETVAVDIADNKLELASKLGAMHTINVSEEDATPSPCIFFWTGELMLRLMHSVILILLISESEA